MPLVVKGLRQCGKTYSVLDFARKNYTHVVYLNFEAYPQLGQAFEGTLAVDQIMMMVSAQLGLFPVKPSSSWMKFRSVRRRVLH